MVGKNITEHEKDGFLNLRDKHGNVVPLFRAMSKKNAENNNRDPIGENRVRCGQRRTPKSAPPLVDFLLEAWRLLFYPDFPSRQCSVFANLNDYQTKHLADGNSLYLVLPHESATVSISGIIDFVLSEPEKELIYRFVSKTLNAENYKSSESELKSCLEYKKQFDIKEYTSFHNLLKSMESMERRMDLRSVLNGHEPALVDSLKKWHGEMIEELKPLLSYWKNSELVKNMLFSGKGTGNEVLIKGPVHYIPDIEVYCRDI